MHDGLDRVGDDLARDEREVHALVAHRDAVGDRDRAELQRVAAAGVHALLGALREAVEAQVAGGDLVPRARDADLRLVPVGVAHADGAEHSAGRHGLDAVGDDAAAGFDVDASSRHVRGYACEVYSRVGPHASAPAGARAAARQSSGCFAHAHRTRRSRPRRPGRRGRRGRARASASSSVTSSPAKSTAVAPARCAQRPRAPSPCPRGGTRTRRCCARCADASAGASAARARSTASRRRCGVAASSATRVCTPNPKVFGSIQTPVEDRRVAGHRRGAQLRRAARASLVVVAVERALARASRTRRRASPRAAAASRRRARRSRAGRAGCGPRRRRPRCRAAPRARRPRRAASGSARALIGSSTSGASVPSKSSATSRRSDAATRAQRVVQARRRSCAFERHASLAWTPASACEERRATSRSTSCSSTRRRSARMRRPCSRRGISTARMMASFSPSMSCGLTSTALPQLVGRAGELAQHQHAVGCRRGDATYSLATRFMPSRSAVTSMTSAAR